MEWKSINQEAQETGDTSAKEAARIVARRAAVARAWRLIAYRDGETSCTAEKVAQESELPVRYVTETCAIMGYPLSGHPNFSA